MCILLTIAVSIFIVTVLAVVFFGGNLGDRVALHFGMSSAFAFVWKILQLPFALLFMLVTFDLIYYFAPNDRRPKRRWFTKGAVTAVVLWFLVSLAFRLYLHF